MKNNLSYLLVSPDALRRGWLGWILSSATARTGGLELVWAGLVEASGGRSELLIIKVKSGSAWFCCKVIWGT